MEKVNLPLDTALMERVVSLCRDAGRAILEIYNREEFTVETKSDSSPVTAADLAAHRVLIEHLPALLPGVPVLSEEGSVPEFSERKRWSRYWIIDPLDGTKEFIKRNGEFTVNVALVEDHIPVLGVVHVPVSGVSYAGIQGLGATKISADGVAREISVRSMSGRGKASTPVSVVASRSHGAAAVEQLLVTLADKLGVVDTCNMGSSLKLCLVAEGSADIYPRLAPTMEWDTAAAQAVVEAAGGLVVNTDLEVLRYNLGEALLNPYFYVLGDQDYPWQDLLHGLRTEAVS